MALKAGYVGVKKSLLSTITNFAGAKIIKTIGNGLKLTNAGTLSVDYGRGLSVEGGKLIGTGGAFEYIAEGSIVLPSDTSTLSEEISLDFIPDIISVNAPLTDRGSNCYFNRLISPGVSFWYIPDETKQEINNCTPGSFHATGLHIAEVNENKFRMKTGSGANTVGITVTYKAFKINMEV